MGTKVTLSAYRTAGRPVQVSIDPDATEGARVGTDLTLGSAVTLPSGQVLPAGTVLTAAQILNAFVTGTSGTGPVTDWPTLTNVPNNSFTFNNSNGVVIQDLTATFGISGLNVTVGTVDLDTRYSPISGGTTAQFRRGDGTWSSTLTGPLSVEGNATLGNAITDEQRLNGNVGINGASYGSGSGVAFIANATTAPTANPTGGGILYCEGGALKFRGSSGTITTLGPA